MYIRINRTSLSPRKSVQIVEGIRVGKKVKQKIVRYVGVAQNDFELEKLKNLAQEYIAKIEKERLENSKQLSLFIPTDEEMLEAVKNRKGRKPRKQIKDILPPKEVNLDEVKEVARITEGIHEVGNAVYDTLGYNKILKKRDDKILRDLILARIADPASKHRSQKILAKKFGKPHDLDAIYRMMDKLYEKIDQVKQCTFEKTQGLFPRNMNLVLFDVTTLYFESTEVDELRDFGYSKDCRFNTTQVVLALATNEDGLPIGYELFEGNKAEVKTLISAVNHWKTLFNIGEVCFIGDRAMFTKDNLKLLEESGYQYVVAAKLRSLSQDKKAKVLDEKNYRPLILKDDLAWAGEFEHENRRLIVSYKKKRAINDSKERERLLNKIKKLIGTKGPTKKLISNHGVKKFTSTDASKTFLDEEKIYEDSLWDGLHGVITNIKEDSKESILARYARLWIIEESFRIKKHLLKIRPIFHWKPNRIHAHIAICYMSFAILRHLQYRVALTQKISPEIIIEELKDVQASIYIHQKTKDLYRLPSYFSNTARKIYKAFDLVRSEDAEVYIT